MKTLGQYKRVLYRVSNACVVSRIGAVNPVTGY